MIFLMGTYYRLVNITRKQWYEPGGIKQGNFLSAGAEIAALLLNWTDDEVRMVGDWADEGWWEKSHEADWQRVTMPLQEATPDSAEQLLKYLVEKLGAPSVSVLLDKVLAQTELCPTCGLGRASLPYYDKDNQATESSCVNKMFHAPRYR